MGGPLQINPPFAFPSLNLHHLHFSSSCRPSLLLHRTPNPIPLPYPSPPIVIPSSFSHFTPISPPNPFHFSRLPIPFRFTPPSQHILLIPPILILFPSPTHPSIPFKTATQNVSIMYLQPLKLGTLPPGE